MVGMRGTPGGGTTVYKPRPRASIVPYFVALTFILAVLKLAGLFPWSWWYVLTPLWAPTAIALLGSAAALVWVLAAMALRGGPSRR
jgi:hypothetical protein